MTFPARLRHLPAASPLLLCAFLVAALLVGGARAQTDARADARTEAQAATRAEFQRAYARVGDGAGAPGEPAPADSARLRGYVLYPYLQAARLVQALRDAGAAVPVTLDERIAEFLRAQDGQPVARELRTSWLTSLAERRQWERFLAFHRPAADDAALRCHGLTARIQQQQTEGLADAVVPLWLTPRSLPACERAFEWLRGTGALDDGLVEQRVRLALEAGNSAFARQIAQPLPPDRAAPLLQWAALLENPRREIDGLIAAPKLTVDPAALRAGWARLARTDRAAARQRFAPLMRARGLQGRDASPFALALALPLSWDRDAEALAYFTRVDAADFDEVAREWHVRAALWAGDWRAAARVISAMPDAQRGSARWRYWAARAAERTGEAARSRELYESILREDNWYSAMAAARLARSIAPDPRPVAAEEARITALEQQPPLLRARELRASGLIRDAQAEWRFAQEALPAADLPQAVHLASRWGWHDQAVATATAARIFNDYALLYPRPYDAQVAAAAKTTGLAPELIYGVIRQESLYRADAVSSADARGLMQLLPETARRTARQWQLAIPSSTALFEPSVNVVLGAAHVRDLLDRVGGQLPLALASYNAGPNAARRWLPGEPIAPDVWVENIPFNETRAYVQRILWHTVVFRWLASGEAQDTRAWLADIHP